MRPITTLALPLLALTACAAPESGGPGLAESRWRFVTIDGAAPASDRAKLSFEPRSLGADAGCNAMGGPWRIERGRLIAGPLVATRMYCEGSVWGQEQAISALLAGGPEITVEGDSMTLRSSGHSARLTRIR